jgi:hypothetical protein
LLACLVTSGLFLFAGAVGFLAALGRLSGWARGPLVCVIALAVFLVPLVAASAVAAEQPGLYHAADPRGVCSSGADWPFGQPCGFFWGCAGNFSISTSCNAGIGWDLAVLSSFLGLVGGGAWWAAYRDRWERNSEEEARILGAASDRSRVDPRGP